MAASTIVTFTWTNDTGTPAVPVNDGTLINNAELQKIFAAVNEMFARAAITFGGVFSAEGFGAHLFSAGGSGGNSLAVRNTSAGTTNYAEVRVGNNSSATAGRLRQTSSTFTAVAPYAQDSLHLIAERGELVLGAPSGSDVLVYSGTTEIAMFGGAGVLRVGSVLGGSGIQRCAAFAGPGEATASPSEIGVKNATIIVADTGGSPNSGGAIEFGFGYGSYGAPSFAGIKSLGSDGTGYTLGDLCVSLRASTADLFLTPVLYVRQGGALYLNDSANVNNLKGLTLNQAAADDEIFTLKSSDVSHPMTSVTEADTYGYLKKKSATDGGLQIVGLGDGSAQIAVEVFGCANGTNGGKSTSAEGSINLVGSVSNGAGSVQALGTNANVLAVKDLTNTRFILDADGDSHQDVGTAWTNFDDHEDVDLLHALSAGVSKTGDPLRRAFGRLLTKHRKTLERAGLVTFNADGHHFINWSRTHMLTIGAVRQLGTRLAAQQREIGRLQRALAAGA